MSSPEKGRTTDKFPGLERLNGMMMALIELGKRKTGQKERREEAPTPRNVAQQRAIMARETEKALEEMLRQGVASIFVLSPVATPHP